MTDEQAKQSDTAASTDKPSTEEAKKESGMETSVEKSKDELGTTMLPPSQPLPGTKQSLGTQAASQVAPDGTPKPVEPLTDLPKLVKHETAVHPAAGRMPAIQPAISASDKMLDRKAAYRRWLEARSKDELIDLIVGLESKEPALEITEKMMKVSTGELNPQATFIIPADMTYTPLPDIKETESKGDSHPWKIILVNLELGNKPTGLIIDSEVSVGRAVGESKPDFDLTPFGASTRGVSRLHAKFRPTANGFAVIDQKSTNGTYCNKSRIEPEKEHPLKDGDILAFGRVNFLFKVVSSPIQN